MHNLFLLLRVQTDGMLGISRFVHTKSKGQRAKTVLLALCLLLGAGGIAAGLFALCEAAVPMLKMLNLLHILPVLAFAMGSVLCLMTSMFVGAGTLFSTRDTQLLLSMPISVRTLVTARLIGLYLTDFVLQSIFLLPILVQYGRYADVAPGAYLITCVCTLLALPVLPMVLGTVLSTVLHAIAARARNKNLWTMLFIFGATIGAMALSLYLPSLALRESGLSMLLNLSEYVTSLVTTFYPPTRWFVNALLGRWGDAVLLFALSAAGFVGVVFLLSQVFQAAYARISSISVARKKVKTQFRRVHSPLHALFRREVSRYVSTPMYVVNTSFGFVTMILLSVALYFFGEPMFVYLDMGIALGVDVRAYVSSFAAFFLFLLACIAPTTTVSISLEGLQFPAIQNLPLRASDYFLAKAIVYWMLLVPSTLISATLLCIALSLDGTAALSCYLLPLSAGVLIPPLGLLVNLLFPRFQWKSEIEVVKQSLSATIGIFGGILLGILPIVILFQMQVDVSKMALLLTGVYTLLGIGLWGVLLTWGKRRLASLGEG